MKSKTRIKPTLQLVEKVWNIFPDLRLGQLLWFLADNDPFYIEDTILCDLIKEHLKENEKHNN